MALQFSVAVRNARLDAVETAVGTGPKLYIITGSAPANCAAAETGTRLASMTLPSDWMSNAASGTKALLGVWEDTSADATGTAGYFRLYDSTSTTCHAQGTITATGGGGDMTLDNVSIASSQDVRITGFVLTEGNA